MKMSITTLWHTLFTFVVSLHATLLNAAEISFKLDSDHIKFAALNTLPMASEEFENSGCLDYLELSQSTLYQKVAMKNWNVTSGVDYGPFSFISFSGEIGTATSGMCSVSNTNIAVYHDAELVGVIYTDAEHDCLLGSISLNSYGSIDIYSGCFIRSKIAQITLSGSEIRIGAPTNKVSCDGVTILPNLYGANINDARRSIIEFGWQPYEDNPRLMDYEKEYPPYYISERAIYPELVACSGTGAAFCSFEYISDNKSVLTLVTAGEEQRTVVKVEDTCDNLNALSAGIIPSPADILARLPVCMFASSFGPMCPSDENERASFRAFTNQSILNMEFTVQTALIETENWYYSISDLEPFREGFKFTFTDDAKSGTYLVAEDFYVERTPDQNAWQITGQEVVYVDGDDQSEVGRFVKLAKPFVLEGLR